jgi:hypothetical protein
MHSSGEIDPLLPEHRDLLGLDNGDGLTREINKESFIEEFQEINGILQELNNEVVFNLILAHKIEK